MLEKLFTPVSIGKLRLNNRIVMPSMSLMLADVIGQVTQRQIDYYIERAKGGVGLIITEATCVDSPVGKFTHPIELTIDSDRYIQGLYNLVTEVHKTQAKIFCQLHHAGSGTRLGSTEGMQPVSASSFEIRGEKISTRALTKEEIKKLINKYSNAALRAKIAGFDGVELHSAHGYLIQQFLSPHTNKRTDEYGGNLEGRMRFLMQIYEKTKSLVGSDYPIGLRLSADEFLPDGLKLSDSMEIAQKLEEAGFDYLNISAGARDSPTREEGSFRGHHGHLVHLAEGIKKVVDIPVITVGKINDPLFADKILVEEKADLVAMGRALIADPELPIKSSKGEFDTIRKCVDCVIGCVMRNNLFFSGCTVNAKVGMEKEYQIKPALRVKKILIAGGGPAGMEAARVSAERGHEVHLFEKRNKLGGQLNYSIVPPHKQELKGILNYLLVQMERLNVEVELEKTLNKNIIQEINPDVLIDATGAIPLIPKIPGVHRKNVITAWDVLSGTVNLSGDIVVAGGGLVGCETAEYLAEKDLNVTLVEMLPEITLEIPDIRFMFLKSFENLGVKILTNTKLTRIGEYHVDIKEINGSDNEIKLDYLILALGARPNKKLSNELKDADIRTIQVGDTVKPRFLINAIHEGFRAGFFI